MKSKLPIYLLFLVLLMSHQPFDGSLPLSYQQVPHFHDLLVLFWSLEPTQQKPHRLIYPCPSSVLPPTLPVKSSFMFSFSPSQSPYFQSIFFYPQLRNKSKLLLFRNLKQRNFFPDILYPSLVSSYLFLPPIKLHELPTLTYPTFSPLCSQALVIPLKLLLDESLVTSLPNSEDTLQFYCGWSPLQHKTKLNQFFLYSFIPYGLL